MAIKTGKHAREEREKQLVLKHKFENRITIAKYGKENLENGDYTNAIAKWMEYMKTMAEVKRVKSIYDLRPGHFDPKKDLTEMLMISHIYFEMARIYDAVPRFAEESKKCLELFVIFSANQPYQVVNSELIRKHLKKSIFKNRDSFQNAYGQIFVQSKKCFVVTFCFGSEHQITQDCRRLKDLLLESRRGQELVRLYYKYSSKLVSHWETDPIAHLLIRQTLRPILLVFSKTLLRFILR